MPHSGQPSTTTTSSTKAAATKSSSGDDNKAAAAKKRPLDAPQASATTAKKPKEANQDLADDEQGVLYDSRLGKPRSVGRFEMFLKRAAERNARRRFTPSDLTLDEALMDAIRDDEITSDDLINDALMVHAISALEPSSDKSETELRFRIKLPKETRLAKTLGEHEMLLLRIVQSAGSKGIWGRDLKRLGKLETKAHNKALKELEKHEQIKRFKTVTSSKRVNFICSEFEPLREHTGVPWLVFFSSRKFGKNILLCSNAFYFALLGTRTNLFSTRALWMTLPN